MDTILSLKDVSISFGGVHAVNHVSFDIGKGELVGLIGPNGSGKSTTVNLISGVYKVDGGEIYFKGKKVPAHMDITHRSRLGMGRTFQTPKPFGNLTVFDNVMSIALLKDGFREAAAKTNAVLERTRLASVQDMLSSKLPIERRKWLDLARILVTGADFIMLDEALAGLNSAEMDESLELVRQINDDGVTILFIEHIMRAVVKLCNRVVVLNDGSLLCEGEPSEVLKRPEVIEAYIGGGKFNVIT